MWGKRYQRRYSQARGVRERRPDEVRQERDSHRFWLCLVYEEEAEREILLRWDRRAGEVAKAL